MMNKLIIRVCCFSQFEVEINAIPKGFERTIGET